MAEELAEGVVRAIFTLLKAVFRLLFQIVFELLLELVVEILTRTLSPVFRFIGRVVRFPLRLVEALYHAVLESATHAMKWRPLAHLATVATLVVCAFCLGFGTSLIYHAMQNEPMTLALER